MWCVCTDLWRLPEMLVIHLKRFTMTGNHRDRANTMVRYPLKGLDLGEFVLDSESRDQCVYECYEICNHMGGMGGGHYTAYVKAMTNGRWYNCDDSRVAEVSDETKLVSSAAYMLFYKRRPTKK